MGLSSNSDSKEKVVSTISEIVKISDNWVRYLKKKEDADRMANALTLGLVAGILEIIFALILKEFISYTSFAYAMFLIIIVPITSIIIVSIAVYYLVLRKRKYRFSELLDLLKKMKSGGENQNILENALDLADKMLRILPEVKKKRLDEALAYGIVAFFFTLISMNWGIAMLVAVIVWLYFRWEITRDYEKEVARFDELKHRFEQQEEDFLRGL